MIYLFNNINSYLYITVPFTDTRDLIGDLLTCFMVKVNVSAGGVGNQCPLSLNFSRNINIRGLHDLGIFGDDYPFCRHSYRYAVHHYHWCAFSKICFLVLMAMLWSAIPMTQYSFFSPLSTWYLAVLLTPQTFTFNGWEYGLFPLLAFNLAKVSICYNEKYNLRIE